MLSGLEVMTEFFSDILGLDDDLAAENACRVEHAVGDTLLERLASYVEFIEVSRRRTVRWDEATGSFVARSRRKAKAEKPR